MLQWQPTGIQGDAGEGLCSYTAMQSSPAHAAQTLLYLTIGHDTLGKSAASALDEYLKMY